MTHIKVFNLGYISLSFGNIHGLAIYVIPRVKALVIVVGPFSMSLCPSLISAKLGIKK